ncbi:MAG: ATP-binding protein [Betaproteobacteria bacterium]
MEQSHQDEDDRLRSVAIQNAQTILAARQRAEQELFAAKEALERRTGELAHSVAALRATLDATTDALLVTDTTGRVNEFNARFLAMWGLERNQVVGSDHTRIGEVVRDQIVDPARFVARVEEIYAAWPADTFDVLELTQGRVLERTSRLQMIDGRPVGRVWGFRDITEVRRNEEALRDESRVLEILNRYGVTLASELGLEAVLQAVTDAATQVSGARWGAFFFASHDHDDEALMQCTLSGVPREAFEGSDPPSAAVAFGPSFNAERAIRIDDATTDARYVSVAPGLRMLPARLPVRSYLAVPVNARSGVVLGGLFLAHPEAGVFNERAERLVTGIASQASVAVDNARLYDAARRAAAERERLLESERTARAHAERMGELKDEFLATLSHELRTPLSAILGWAHVLRRGVRGEADLANGLEAIDRNARMQTQLIEDLLDMSRITAGKLRLEVQNVDPTAVIEAAIDTVQPAADAKGIRIEKVLDPSAGPVAGDPARLQQVVWNLLSNAIKFTPKDGRVGITLQRVNSHVELGVTDTGVGIPGEFLAHLFERFRQADASSTRKYGGLGLGLSIVKHLVELHGGTVRAHSAGEGTGATFTVQLPLVVLQRGWTPPQRVHPRSPSAAPEFHPADLNGMVILVVDDEPDARELIGRVLSDCGARVVTAGSATEAIVLHARERPDLMISDIGMPDVDGYELLRRIRAQEAEATGGARVPAIALTAFARSEDRTRALRAGYFVHLSKPVEPSELVATVASVAGRV